MSDSLRLFRHRAPDDPEMNEDKKDRHERITPEPIGPLEFRPLVTQHDHRADGERREQRDRDADISKQGSPGVGEDQQTAPQRLQHDRLGGSAEFGMNIGELLEKDAVLRHRVVNSRPDHGHDVERAENRIVMMPVIQAEVLRPNSAVVATSDMRSAPFISVTGTA